MNEINVRELRKKLGITQSELASIMGVSVQTIKNWEAGGTIPAPSKAKLKEVANLHVSGQGNTVANNINGNNLQNSDAVINALIHQLDEKDRQVAKSQEQIDRLLTIIEKLNSK